MTRAVLTLTILSCATAAGPNGERSADGQHYPRRAAGCELAVYHSAVPGVTVWDDLGIAEITCHISDPVAECLRRLRNEACHMGGDLIYNVPTRPLRPRDQVLVYRGQVAHTQTRAAVGKDDQDLPPPASAEESAGPVVPFPPSQAPATAAPSQDARAPADRQDAAAAGKPVAP